MPVKVRCPSCKKVLNAPDKARGKALRCPGCQGRVRVPDGRAASGSRSGTPAKATTRRRARQPVTAEEDDFLAGLDVRRLERHGVPVCPNCGAELDEEDQICPECEMDLATGRMPEKRKGPDPSRFYGEAWSDSWRFLWNNVGLAVKTGFIGSLFTVLAIASVTMAVWVKTIPPMVFWSFLYFLSLAGVYGWLWYLTLEIIKTTLNKKAEKVKKAEFDFFLAVALGVKAVVWPIVLVLPLVPIVLPIVVVVGVASVAGFGATGMGVLFLGYLALWALLILMYPIAMVHMTAPYTYKAWLPWEMIKVVFKNIGPCLYWLLVAIAVQLPLAIPLGLVALFFGGEIFRLFTESVQTASNFMLDLHDVRRVADDPSRWQVFYDATFSLLTLYLCLTPLWFLEAFPAVFTMRAIGLLGYYNRRWMELVYKQPANVPCGFGARYLATLVDSLLLGLAMGALFGLFVGVTLLIESFGVMWTSKGLMWIMFLIFLYMPFHYYARQESGITQATLGKKALGIVVTDMQHKPVGMKIAAGRFFARILSAVPLGIGFLMCLFTEKKQTLHDMMSNSLVVWRGDDEMTE